MTRGLPAAPSHDQAASGTPTAASKRPEHAFRADIQGLRALAVSLVVVFHLYPWIFPGGFVGVDVFFVISGFLITSGLVKGRYRTTGRVRLVDFWGRRARRLMPAAVLVLVVTWVGSRIFLPVTQVPAAATQIRASALYFQNWILAHDAVTYATANNAASPVQHFWSLSVEEQFYLVWPLLLAGAGLLVARRARAGRWLAIALASIVVLASFLYSVHETRTNPDAAYFITTTRIWELAVGGLLALISSDRATSTTAGTGTGTGSGAVRLMRGAAPLVGLALIVGSAIWINGTLHFPGWIAAFPVVGSAILLAGLGRGPVVWLLSLRPIVFIGDISYSLYLWHWPLIVLWLAYSGGTIGAADGPAIIVVSIILAWLTKRFVEDGVRLSPLLLGHPFRSVSTVVLAVVPVVLVSLYLNKPAAHYHLKVDAAHPGAAVLAGDAKTLPNVPLAPPLSEISQDIPIARGSNGCELSITASKPHECIYGDTTDPVLTVALVGDSHAAQWSSVMNDIAKKNRWKLVFEIHASCPFSATGIVDSNTGLELSGCDQWSKTVMHDLVTTIKPDVVIVTDQPNKSTAVDHKPDARSQQLIGQGMATYFTTLLAHGIKVIGLHETPTMPFSVPDCLASRTGSIAKCSAPAAEAIPKNTPLDTAAKLLPGRLKIVNMNDLICGPTTCAPVVGNVLVYRDEQHVGLTYSETLLPYLDERLRATHFLG